MTIHKLICLCALIVCAAIVGGTFAIGLAQYQHSQSSSPMVGEDVHK